MTHLRINLKTKSVNLGPGYIIM